MKTCILISTCEKYRRLADFTRNKIEEFWPQPPPIFRCGIAGGELSLRDDPRNWMRVTRSACADLMADGFDAAYLILEDHPPFAACDPHALNDEIPAMMRDLGAVSIALSGHGQGRQRFGDPVAWQGWNLDLCLRTTLWKLPLHPALWNLSALAAILDGLMTALPESEQTPWAFERKGGAADAPLADELVTRSYRIDGLQRSVAPAPSGLKPLRAATDLFRFAVRKIGGEHARAAVDARLLGVHHYYQGPYPLFWSGLMRKGGINRDAEFFLMLTGRTEWLEVLRDVSGP